MPKVLCASFFPVIEDVMDISSDPIPNLNFVLIYVITVQGESVDGFLESLGLEKYSITFQAEEVRRIAIGLFSSILLPAKFSQVHI